MFTVILCRMVASKQAKHEKLMEATFHKQRSDARGQSVSNKSKAYSEQPGPGTIRPEGARYITLISLTKCRYEHSETHTRHYNHMHTSALP